MSGSKGQMRCRGVSEELEEERASAQLGGVLTVPVVTAWTHTWSGIASPRSSPNWPRLPD